MYQPGKPLPLDLRQVILDNLYAGYGVTEISNHLCVAKSSVVNIRNHHSRYGTVRPFDQGGTVPQKLTDDVLEVIEVWKLQKPSTYAHEISNRLVKEQICDQNNVPAPRTIQEGIRDKLGMTHKKITSKARETFSPENQVKIDEFLDFISSTDPATVHFFDEASVVVTSGNRKYRSTYHGLPAVEIQRYASNANYTINLLHSLHGVDFYNVIPNASNGQELIAFFVDAIDHERACGTQILLEGDTVVMDNCGFHHGRLTEPLLRELLSDKGIQLIYQPPYSPEFNTCELCFNQIRKWLQSHSRYRGRNSSCMY